jgi:hypothetical protein
VYYFHISLTPAELQKMVIGFHTLKEGELTLKTSLTEYTEWDPYYFKLGEGKLVYFVSAKVCSINCCIFLMEVQDISHHCSSLFSM